MQELIMIFLFEKSLKKKGCHALCSRMIQFCDFWKISKPAILKIFMTFLSDFCKLYPTYYKNIQNLYDEIAQILVQRKLKFLQERFKFLSDPTSNIKEDPEQETQKEIQIENEMEQGK
jgi:hypothetical protein